MHAKWKRKRSDLLFGSLLRLCRFFGLSGSVSFSGLLCYVLVEPFFSGTGLLALSIKSFKFCLRRSPLDQIKHSKLYELFASKCFLKCNNKFMLKPCTYKVHCAWLSNHDAAELWAEKNFKAYENAAKKNSEKHTSHKNPLKSVLVFVGNSKHQTLFQVLCLPTIPLTRSSFPFICGFKDEQALYLMTVTKKISETSSRGLSA